jgi:hypothetical protein
MVAVNKKKIRCVVLAVPVDTEGWTSRGAMVQELVPGADPYVAQLIKRLQDEVRAERRAEELSRRERLMAAIEPATGPQSTKPRFEQRQLIDELEVPWFDMPEEDPWSDDAVPEFNEPNDDAAPSF